MMFGYRDEFEYFQCLKCGCLQIQEYVVDVDKYYKNSYYSFEVSKNIILNYLLRQRNIFELSGKGFVGNILAKKVPNLTLRLLSNLLSDKNKKVLDVGCGAGKFLRILHQFGFKKLTGIDPFIKQDVVIDNEFILLKKQIDDLDGGYDLIFFNHSLEHMPNQHEVFNNISRLLSDNGVCVIRIPISSSYAWEYYGVNWVQLDAPRHYYLHSINSLDILAESAGLKITKIQYDSTAYQLFASEQYAKDIPMQDVRFRNKGSERDEKKTKDLNLNKRGDQAIFTLMRM